MFGFKVAQHVCHLFPAGHPGQKVEVKLTEQSVQDRALRFLVEPLDVDDAAVAGSHHHRNSALAGPDTQHCFHRQVVTFLDGDIEAVEERVEGFRGQSGVDDIDGEVRI